MSDDKKREPELTWLQWTLLVVLITAFAIYVANSVGGSMPTVHWRPHY